MLLKQNLDSRLHYSKVSIQVSNNAKDTDTILLLYSKVIHQNSTRHCST